MKNLKVKVNNEAESFEVQQLLEEFFGLESVMFSGSTGLVAWDSKCFSTYPANTPSFADRCKEITIQELRDMAMAQQKQYEPFLTPECALNDQYAEIEQVRQHKHYFKDVSNIDEIDVYMVLKLFNVTDPCLQHIAKKALCAGKRGHKDLKKDLQDILDTAVRAVDINK